MDEEQGPKRGSFGGVLGLGGASGDSSRGERGMNMGGLTKEGGGGIGINHGLNKEGGGGIGMHHGLTKEGGGIEINQGSRKEEGGGLGKDRREEGGEAQMSQELRRNGDEKTFGIHGNQRESVERQDFSRPTGFLAMPSAPSVPL